MEDKPKRKPAWHRDPLYKPNYGKAKSLLPPTCIGRVVLHDNTSEDRRLREDTRLLERQQVWSKRLLNINKKAFIVRQLLQQQITMAHAYHGKHVTKLLPDDVVEDHRRYADLEVRAMFYTGGKNLPFGHRIRTLLARNDTLELFEQSSDTDDNNDEKRSISEPPQIRIVSSEDGSCVEKPPNIRQAAVKTQNFLIFSDDKLKPVTSPHRFSDTKFPALCSPYYSKSAMESVRQSILLQPDNPFTVTIARTRPDALGAQMRRNTNAMPERTASYAKGTAGASARRSCASSATEDPRFTALKHSLTPPSDANKHPTYRFHSAKKGASNLDGFAMLSSSNHHGPRLSSSQKRILREKYLPHVKRKMDPTRIHKALATARTVDNGPVAA